MEESNARFMARALELAAQGRYSTHPNPRVGCVLVSDGNVVGEGFHERTGGPHAEVLALKAAGGAARGSTAYVSLEPCCIHGLTPPCTGALVEAGVSRVFAAMEDPNPRICGRGIAQLRQAGVATEVGLLGDEAERLNRGFVSRMRHNRPWVTLKVAVSLDGRTALGSGESRWITGPDARADVHRLRAEAGSVLTSANTVLADDPELTVRDFDPGTARSPDRIVIDTQLRTPESAKVWKSGARRIALCADADEKRISGLRGKGVEVVPLDPDAEGRVNLPEALVTLARMEVNEVLVECGPILAGRLLSQALVDEFVVYLAPTLLGHEGRALAQLPGIKRLDQQLKWRYQDVTQLGSDLRLTLRPVR